MSRRQKPGGKRNKNVHKGQKQQYGKYFVRGQNVKRQLGSLMVSGPFPPKKQRISSDKRVSIDRGSPINKRKKSSVKV